MSNTAVNTNPSPKESVEGQRQIPLCTLYDSVYNAYRHTGDIIVATRIQHYIYPLRDDGTEQQQCVEFLRDLSGKDMVDLVCQIY